MKVLIILLLAVILAGCSVRVSETSADKFKDKVTYFKDSRTGLCFGVVAIARKLSPTQEGIGLACVPCKNVENFIK